MDTCALHDHKRNYILLRRVKFVRISQESYFLRAKAATASAPLSHRNSVCPSVRPLHGWISQTRRKLKSPNLHRRLP